MSEQSTASDGGLKNVASAYNVKETGDRLVKIISSKGMKVIARIDHSAAAEKVGEDLRPTELILFGNPIAGTPLMQSRQSMGIDLPQKILVWQDDKAKTWLTYSDPDYLARRHDIKDREELITKIGLTLKDIADEAS